MEQGLCQLKAGNPPAWQGGVGEGLAQSQCATQPLVPQDQSPQSKALPADVKTLRELLR